VRPGRTDLGSALRHPSPGCRLQDGGSHESFPRTEAGKAAGAVRGRGLDSVEAMIEATVFDSVSPAICTICGYTAEMEPDQDRGYCESCGANTVVSALVLAGII
jgi:hypothetical protein